MYIKLSDAEKQILITNICKMDTTKAEAMLEHLKNKEKVLKWNQYVNNANKPFYFETKTAWVYSKSGKMINGKLNPFHNKYIPTNHQYSENELLFIKENPITQIEEEKKKIIGKVKTVVRIEIPRTWTTCQSLNKKYSISTFDDLKHVRIVLKGIIERNKIVTRKITEEVW